MSVQAITALLEKYDRRVAIGDKTIADILAVLMSDWSLDGLDKIHSIVRVHHRQILKGDE
ncbi:hypothetical protein [Brevundimonas sp.]|uniref:hypothetical protein n=1 Tax=Brevundimonas sp. TaxID=1871086 RepID=UPI00289CC940|nr:hypothetical protein [Brevundimonas sp.]